MIQEDIKILGIRYKEEKKTFTAGFAGSIFMIVLSIVIATVLMVIPAKPDQVIYKIILGVVFYGCAIFFFFLIFLIKKNKKKSELLNSYSPIAIYYKNKSICIDEGEVTEIKCEDIKKVTVNHNTKVVSYGVVQSTTILPDGSITIVTNDKKKHVALQIKNIDAVKENVEYYIKTKKYDVNENISLVLAKDDFYTGHYIMDKKSVFANKTDDSEEKKEIIVKRSLDIRIKNPENEQELESLAKTLREVIRNLDDVCQKVATNTAKELLEKVKYWNDGIDDSVKDLTEEDFANILKQESLTITITEPKEYSLNFGLGDLLYDSWVRYDASTEDDKYMVTIEG